MSISYQYKNDKGNYTGHCFGDGFTIVWESRPLGDFKQGATIEGVLSVCLMQLEYMIDMKVATAKERFAFGRLVEILDMFDDD